MTSRAQLPGEASAEDSKRTKCDPQQPTGFASRLERRELGQGQGNHSLDQHLPLRRGPMHGLAACLILIGALWLQWRGVRKGYWVDLDVYVMGANAAIRGQDLYGVSVHGLPFTYSPFAAVAFVPATWLPPGALRLCFTLASLGSYALSVFIVAQRMKVDIRVALLVGIGGLSLEPYKFNLMLGQINLFLMLAVVLDCLAMRPQHRGWLTGIAAGIKIVPGFFVFYFILRKDWGAVARAGIGFLLTVAVGALFAPGETARFWSGGFFTLARWGPETVAGVLNQSFQGVALRFAGQDQLAPLLTVVLCVMGAGLGALVAWRCLAAGNACGAVSALAVGALLGSPISWSHHWVWIVPVLIVISAQSRALAWILGGLFLIGPLNLLGQPEPYEALRLGVGEQIVGALYVIAGLIALGLLWRSGPFSGNSSTTAARVARGVGSAL